MSERRLHQDKRISGDRSKRQKVLKYESACNTGLLLLTIVISSMIRHNEVLADGCYVLTLLQGEDEAHLIAHSGVSSSGRRDEIKKVR